MSKEDMAVILCMRIHQCYFCNQEVWTDIRLDMLAQPDCYVCLQCADRLEELEEQEDRIKSTQVQMYQ